MNCVRRGFMIAGLMLTVAATPALAQQPSGTITFTGGSIAAGVGFTWGGGDLQYKGQTYHFTLRGMSIVDVGVSSIEGTGDVYDLQRVEDFAGNYVAGSVGATPGLGGTMATMKNQHGVRIEFHSKTVGLKLNFSADGVVIALK